MDDNNSFHGTQIDPEVGLTVDHFYQNKTSTLYPLCKTMHHLITSTKRPKIDHKSLRSIQLYGQYGHKHVSCLIIC